jgi:hypothetical protein
MQLTAPTVLKCTVCRKHKAQLRTRKSKLISDMPLLLCNECFEQKREPRFAIILTARKEGYEAVEDYIKYNRYVGPEIILKELL